MKGPKIHIMVYVYQRNAFMKKSKAYYKSDTQKLLYRIYLFRFK